ncbi:uncharacterized protein LOC143270929 [Peromyscus maniculatus bairdii]|uniref:uncharacterized protein LOC143270929 n=1 Tax=Peromyscus maniculatus bairdii TaxID=230844 RepID=UPI003FD1B5CA
MQPSVLIREASLCSGWQLIQRRSIGQIERVSICGVPSHKWYIYVTHLRSRLRTLQKKGKKDSKIQRNSHRKPDRRISPAPCSSRPLHQRVVSSPQVLPLWRSRRGAGGWRRWRRPPGRRRCGGRGARQRTVAARRGGPAATASARPPERQPRAASSPPRLLACSLARGPGRRGHGRQAERPRRQRPHPRLLGLGPALRRRAAAPGAAGRDPRGGEPAAAAGRTALGRPGSRPRCPAAASVPTAPRSRSLGGAVGSAAGGRAAQSAFSIPDGGGAQAGPGMGSAGDCPRPATAAECTSTLTARSAPGTAERARYKKDGSGAASPVGAESPRPECYSPPDSAGGTGGSCRGPQTAEDEVPASSPIAGSPTRKAGQTSEGREHLRLYRQLLLAGLQGALDPLPIRLRLPERDAGSAFLKRLKKTRRERKKKKKKSWPL